MALKCAAAADTDQVGDSEISQLFDTDRGGWPTHTGGNGENPTAFVSAGDAFVFAVESFLMDIREKRGDRIDPRRIAGKNCSGCMDGSIQLDMRHFYGGCFCICHGMIASFLF